MGGGHWTSESWTSYASSTISGKTAAKEIYTTNALKTEFNPALIKVRESCDSVEHPNSTPIIIGLDVTGSMDHIIMNVAKRLGDTVAGILDRKPVTDPQILFAAIGDSNYGGDRAPFQVTQFESDIRIAKQLTDLYFEGGGGGNRMESYPLAWYFAANKTKTDNFVKHGKKGFIFTMGDDGFPVTIGRNEIKEVFGDNVDEDVDVKALLNQVNREWEVYHLCLKQGWTYRDSDMEKWQKLLGEHAIKCVDYTKIPEIIISIMQSVGGTSIDEIIDSWDGSTAIAVKEALCGMTSNSTNTSGLVKF